MARSYNVQVLNVGIGYSVLKQRVIHGDQVGQLSVQHREPVGKGGDLPVYLW